MLSQELIIAQARAVLEAGSYRVRVSGFSAPDALGTLLAEDAYGIVGIVVYETFEALYRSWPEAQAALAILLQHSLRAGDPKLKEGYLVLICATPYFEFDRVRSIKEDTTLLRKFVALGQQLETASDIEGVLSPLLPILDDGIETITGIGVLERLPELLERYKIDEDQSKRVVKAFVQGEPLMDAFSEGRDDAT